MPTGSPDFAVSFGLRNPIGITRPGAPVKEVSNPFLPTRTGLPAGATCTV